MKMNRAYKKGMFLLPSMFSLTNLFFGFMSITVSLQGRFRLAAELIIVAAVLDGLDGIVARATHTHSDFGIQMDSLSDAISFGGATSILLYYWGLQSTGKPGFLFSFIFLAAGVLRLARYNVRTKAQPDRRYFQGLPIPSAAVFMSSIVFLHPKPVEAREIAFLLALLTVVTAFCMVSTIRYKNILSFNSRRRIDTKTALFGSIIISALVFFPKIFLVAFFAANAFSGPAAALHNELRQYARKRENSSEAPR